MFAVPAVVAVVFGVVGAAAAFVITYAEYEHHGLPQRRLVGEALRAALAAFVVLAAVAVAGGVIVGRCGR
jgi:formate hydrogenlyase subunit 3/multisubunit Na+/H+ antiporter MnhD subunit